MIYEPVTIALADVGVERGQLQAVGLRCYEPMLYGFVGPGSVSAVAVLSQP